MTNWRDERAVRARAAHYAAIKDTDSFNQAEARRRRETAAAIADLGYSRARAERAVREYADAARDTQLGPDWPGFLEMVKVGGLVDKDGRPSRRHAARS